MRKPPPTTGAKRSRRPVIPSGGSHAAEIGFDEGAVDLLGGQRWRDAESARMLSAYVRRGAGGCRGRLPETMATRRPAPAAYRCTECGWTTPKWVGRCGECQQWGTVVEAAEQTGILRPITPGSPRRRAGGAADHPIDTSEAPRRTSGVGEFDRVLGGGLVPGAAILLSGEPGVGKSTLLLEVAAQLAPGPGGGCCTRAPRSRPAQVRLRAERTGALHDELYLASETDLATILGHIDEVRARPGDRRLGADGVVVAVRGHGGAPVSGARGRLDAHPRREGPRAARS